MKNTGTNDERQSKSRNIALGAALGLVIGGGIDMLTNDTGWGLVIGILAGAVVGYFVKFPLPVMEYRQGAMQRILYSAVAFLGGLFLSQWLMDLDLARPYQLVAAVLPAVPGAFLVYAIGSALSGLDELQRRIQLEAIGIGFGTSILAFMTYGLLVQVGISQVSWMFVPVVMILLWGVGKLWTIWKYR